MRSQRLGVRTMRRMEETPWLCKHARDGFVGRDHELLDQLGRKIALLVGDADDIAIRQYRVRLHALEVQRAVTKPFRLQRLRDFVLHPQLPFQFRASAELRGFRPADVPATRRWRNT